MTGAAVATAMSGIQGAGDLAMTQSLSPHLSKIGKSGNVDKTAKDFEGMFMSQMLQPMMDSVDVDPVFGGGEGERVMRSFLTQEYGKLAAGTGRLGIAAAVKNEMIRAQTGGSTPASANLGGYNAARN